MARFKYGLVNMFWLFGHLIFKICLGFAYLPAGREFGYWDLRGTYV